MRNATDCTRPADTPRCTRLAEQRADLVAHQPVKDAPRLLGVDQLHVDFAGMAESLLHGIPGDFVEHHPFRRRCPVIPVGGGLKVPGNGLALPVGVCGEVNVFGVVPSGLELAYKVFLVLYHLIERGKIVLDVDPKAPLRQVPNVALRGSHHVVVAEDLADSPGLGRRLHDDQVFALGLNRSNPAGSPGAFSR